jgi:hypothetical protein
MPRLWPVFSVLFLFVATLAAAAEAPVIAAGREKEIVALVAPYFGANKDVTPGFRVGDVDVQPRAIRFFVVSGDQKGAIRLEHPDAAPKDAERSASFAILYENATEPRMSAALHALADVVRNNDKGAFWPAVGPRPGVEDAPSSRFATGKKHWLTTLRPPAVLRDGVLLFVSACVLMWLHLRRVLSSESRRIALGLVAIVVIGGVLRLTISRETVMNVWPYNREVPLAHLAFHGFLLPAITAALKTRVYLTDIIFKTTLVLAIVTPFAFFAHARYVLRDTRAALFAAALLAVLPNHIRFSRADSEFIQSLATSSLTFVVLYTALRDPSKRWRSVCFALLPILSVATYFVRPENLFFWLVDIGAILLTSGDEAPLRRRLLAFVEVTAAAAFAFVVHLLAQYKDSVQQGLSVRTITSAVSIFFDVRLNTLVNPAITPPGITLLAVAGGVLLFRRGERARAAFLTLWLLGFFVVHSFVRPSEPAMQARYHLHLITPLLLLAASALPELARLPRPYLVAGALYFAASPILHLGFERDVGFNEMQEFNFLRTAGRAIPDGCTVIELSPAVGIDPRVTLASRLDRISIVLDRGSIEHAFKVINMGRTTEGGEPAETLSAEAQDVLRAPPPCLMIYEGLTCRSHRPSGVARAPACDAALRAIDASPVVSASFRSRIYDEVLAGRLMPTKDGRTLCVQRLVPGEEIPLTLYSTANNPTSIGPLGSGSHDALGRDGNRRSSIRRSRWLASYCAQIGAPSDDAHSELR